MRRERGADDARRKHADDDRRERATELEPERRCPTCGAKLTVQIFPHGYESKCLPCERRKRFEQAKSA